VFRPNVTAQRVFRKEESAPDSEKGKNLVTFGRTDDLLLCDTK
jgi:hypothetical protein